MSRNTSSVVFLSQDAVVRPRPEKSTLAVRRGGTARSLRTETVRLPKVREEIARREALAGTIRPHSLYPGEAMIKKFLFAALALPLALTACEKGPTAPAGTARVGVRFGASSPSASFTRSPSYNVATSRFSTASSTGSLVVKGTNGTLEITHVSFIVSELELKCTGKDDATSPACAKFEAPASFVKLPLTSGVVEVVSTAIPEGSYSELGFKVEDLEADVEDNASERQQVTALLNTIRTTEGYSDFPSRASMVVEGTFTPTGGTPVSFRTYFQAEIEVEKSLNPPLVIGASGASQALTVDVQPALWFKNTDGTVRDLSKLDFASTGSVVEFEVEMDKGFSKVEHD